MKARVTNRGFVEVTHVTYSGANRIIVKESSVCDGTSKHDDLPGSSRLWMGDHHLTHDDVVALVGVLQTWLATGRLTVSATSRADTARLRCRNCGNFATCGNADPNDEPWVLGCADFDNGVPADKEIVAELARMLREKQRGRP